MSIIAPYDRELLRARYQSAEPFPHMRIDNFLEESAALEAAGSFLPFEVAMEHGRTFRKVNEYLKMQIVDPEKFPPAIQAVSEAFSSPEFIADLEYITGIPGLTWDPSYAGGGMHQTARSGWLDVHVDFNYNENLHYHRRLNILLYLNPTWDPEWGGHLELWDQDVSVCHHSIVPSLNRCVVFTTSEISYHGVTAVRCPEGYQRQSFAAYYYTREAPVGWDGTKHSTVFKARPEEFMKKHLLMPGEAARDAAASRINDAKSMLKTLLRKG